MGQGEYRAVMFGSKITPFLEASWLQACLNRKIPGIKDSVDVWTYLVEDACNHVAKSHTVHIRSPSECDFALGVVLAVSDPYLQKTWGGGIALLPDRGLWTFPQWDLFLTRKLDKPLKKAQAAWVSLQREFNKLDCTLPEGRLYHVAARD
jgi:hypothetical protein